jgi:hypothetical protein
MKSKTMMAVEQPELALTRKADHVDVPLSLVLKQPSLSSAIALCVQLSGLEDKEVYLTLGIDAGHWSRIMKGDAHFPVNKLSDLMDMCGNEAPLMWWSHSRGYGLVLLQSEAERRADAAEERAKEMEKQLLFLTQILQGKAA